MFKLQLSLGSVCLYQVCVFFFYIYIYIYIFYPALWYHLHIFWTECSAWVCLSAAFGLFSGWLNVASEAQLCVFMIGSIFSRNSFRNNANSRCILRNFFWTGIYIEVLGCVFFSRCRTQIKFRVFCVSRGWVLTPNSILILIITCMLYCI